MVEQLTALVSDNLTVATEAPESFGTPIAIIQTMVRDSSRPSQRVWSSAGATLREGTAHGILCSVRSALVVMMVWMVACHPSTTPPDLDGGTLDSSVEDDGSMPHDSGVPDDAHGPGAAALRLLLRVRTDGRVVEEPGAVVVPRGRLTRFDLGIESLAFEGDRPIAPGIRDVGTVSFITGARMVTVTPAAPGLYSGVEISLRANASGEAMDVEIEQVGVPFRLHEDEPMTFELRCPGDAFELGVGERVEVPLYADVDDLGDELLELPVGQLADALMDGFTLACDEARLY